MALPKFLEDLDLAVFSVESATSENDKLSLLRLQRVISSSVVKYNYLEIGSDKGGSLVPLLADPNCAHVSSVDLRPEMQADERGISFAYAPDGEARMLDNLQKQLQRDQLDRLKIFRCDIRDVVSASVPKIDLVLIDGEHTNVACFSDADRVLDFVNGDAIIIFHDLNLIDDAIQNFERLIARLKIEHSTVLLPDKVAAIGLGKYAEILTQKLGSLSAPRDAFFATAQLERWISIGTSMKTRGILTERPENIRTEISGLRFELDKVKQTCELLRRDLKASHQHVAALRESTSWKITGPLRAGKTFLSQLLRRLELDT